MEKLVINIPNKKSALVKQILQGLGVNVAGDFSKAKTDYKTKLTKVSVWSHEDVRDIEMGNDAFNLKPEQW